MKRLALLVAALAGCAADPCDGKGAVCVSLRVEGRAPALERIDVVVGLPDGRRYTGRTDPVTPAIELPVAFALRLPPDALGRLRLDVGGVAGGAVVATGAGTVDVPPSGHAAATVTVGPATVDGGAIDLAAPPDGPSASEGGVFLDGGALDLAPPMGIVIAATPDPLIVLVGTAGTVTVAVTNHTGASITLTGLSATSTPPGAPVIFGSGDCLGTPLADGAQCMAAINFSPTARNRWTVHLTLSYGTKMLPIAFGVNAVAWVNETPVPGVSNLLSVGGTSANDVWAGGAAGTLMHRIGAATTWNGPVSPSPTSGSVTSIWAVPGATNVYFTGGTASLYRYNGGFTSAAPPVTGGVALVSIWGTSESDMYLLSSSSEILHGSFSSSSQARAPDSSNLVALGGDAGNIYAVGGVFAHGVPTGSFSTSAFPSYVFASVWSSGANVFAAGAHGINAFVLRVDSIGNLHFQDFSPVAFSGVWGSSDSDVFAVGSAGAIFHLSAPAGTWTQEPSGVATDLKGVWGAGGEVFAVGGNGTIVHRY